MSDRVVSTGGVESHASSRVSFLAWVRTRASTLTVWTAILVWAIVLFALVRDRFLEFGYARYDLGHIVQAVWSTAHGRPLETTNSLTGEQMARLGLHVDPILGLLAPLWIVAPTPLTLAAVQIAGVGLGALPVFWLARRHSGSERAATLLALSYLAYPWIGWTAVDALHPVTLAIPLFLYCVWFLDTGRLVPFAACAILAAATGELMGLVVAALGIWYALARDERRVGFAIAALGAVWTSIALNVVVPAFSGEASIFYGFFDEVGGSPSGLLRALVTEPWTVLRAASHGGDLLYVFALVAPLAGVFLLAPGLAAVAVPQLGVNLLAGFDSTTDPHAHYIAGIVPFLFAAAAIGLGRLAPRLRTAAAVYVLGLVTAASVILGPWPGALGGTSATYWRGTRDETVAALNRAVAIVPEEAPVTSTGRVGSHLAARRYAYAIPVVGRAEWIVLDTSDTWIPKGASGTADPDAFATFTRAIQRSAEWEKVFEEDGVVVFRRARP